MPHHVHLDVSLITPNGELYQESRTNVVIAPATLGQVSILPNHAPFFTRLEAGEVTIKAEGKSHTFAVYGGFMDVNPGGKVTILADFAQRSEEIDIQNAQRAKEEAEKMMRDKDKYTQEEYRRFENSLRQAIFSIKIAEKIRKKRSIR